MHPYVRERLPQIDELCRKYRVKRLDLCGSGTGNRFDPARSDPDFAVEYLPEAYGDAGGSYFAFKESLERLFERKVDLVASRAVRNRFFARSWTRPKSRYMQGKGLKFLEDIRLAATAIQSYVHGKSEADYVRDQTLRHAVEPEFDINGEALRRLSDEDQECFKRVPDSKRMIGFRNVLAHGYDSVDDPNVWALISTRWAALIAEVTALISEGEAHK